MIIKCIQCESEWKMAAGFSKSAQKEEEPILGGLVGGSEEGRGGVVESRTFSRRFDLVVHQSVEKYELKGSF